MRDLAASNRSSAIKDLEDDLKPYNFKVLDYTSILAATTSFSLEKKIGPIYKVSKTIEIIY